MDFTTYFERIISSRAQDWATVHRPVFLQDLRLVSSESETDHIGELHEHEELLVFRPDLSVSIAIGLPHRRDFKPTPWPGLFSDPAVSSHFMDFLWNGRPILRELRIGVDGNRSHLPLLDLKTGGIPSTKVEVYKLVDAIAGSGQFSEYFARSRMKVSEDPWPA